MPGERRGNVDGINARRIKAPFGASQQFYCSTKAKVKQPCEGERGKVC